MIKKSANYILLCAIVLLSFASCTNNANKDIGSTEKPTETVLASEDIVCTNEPLATDNPSDSDDPIVIEGDIFNDFTAISDNIGIYSTVIELNKSAGNKGQIELIFYGALGSEKEEEQICDFDIYFEMNNMGLYEINTYYNDSFYEKYSNEEKIRVAVNFDEATRAGKVEAYFTPEGGASELIRTGY